MVTFPNCKINLGLRILQKRADGFHDLETVFYPLAFSDALELIRSDGTAGSLEYSQTGLPVSGNTEDNLCVKAWQLLKQDFPQLPAAKMYLHKVLPMGAGLGGGSADGAFALKLINEKFGLNLGRDQLLKYAVELGSDGPFFIINKPCLARGRGEILEEAGIDLAAYTIVLINPGIHVNTGWAFRVLDAVADPVQEKDKRPLTDILAEPIENWRHGLENDFEIPVFEKYPEIKMIKEELYAKGALYSAMSGSGSTVFGIFNGAVDSKLFAGSNYFVKVV